MWALKVISVEAKINLLQVHKSCKINQFECYTAVKSSKTRENITWNRTFFLKLFYLECSSDPFGNSRGSVVWSEAREMLSY